MMPFFRLQSMLEHAESRRMSGTPDSDDFVVRTLSEDRDERADLLAKIQGDAMVAETAVALEREILAIDYALTAYPSSVGV